MNRRDYVVVFGLFWLFVALIGALVVLDINRNLKPDTQARNGLKCVYNCQYFNEM